MATKNTDQKAKTAPADVLVHWAIIAIEYAIVASLLLVAGIVLVRTVVEDVYKRQRWSSLAPRKRKLTFTGTTSWTAEVQCSVVGSWTDSGFPGRWSRFNSTH